MKKPDLHALSRDQSTCLWASYQHDSPHPRGTLSWPMTISVKGSIQWWQMVACRRYFTGVERWQEWMPCRNGDGDQLRPFTATWFHSPSQHLKKKNGTQYQQQFALFWVLWSKENSAELSTTRTIENGKAATVMQWKLPWMGSVAISGLVPGMLQQALWPGGSVYPTLWKWGARWLHKSHGIGHDLDDRLSWNTSTSWRLWF